MDGKGLTEAGQAGKRLKEKKKKRKNKELSASASSPEAQAMQSIDGSEAPHKKKKKKKKKHVAALQPPAEPPLAAELRLPAEPATPAVQPPANASPPHTQAWTHPAPDAPEAQPTMLTDILAEPPTSYAGMMPADHHLVYQPLQQPMDVINPMLEAMVPMAHNGDMDLGLHVDGGGGLMPDGAADIAPYDGTMDASRDLQEGPFVDILGAHLG